MNFKKVEIIILFYAKIVKSNQNPTMGKDKNDQSLVIANNYLYCPITLQVFKDPVIASDGNTYERSAIKKVLDDPNETKRVSPISREKLTTVLIPARQILNLRDELLQTYTKLQKDMYKPSHLHYKAEVSKIVADKEFEKLKSFTDFSWSGFTIDEKKAIFQCDVNSILRYMLDNFINLEDPGTSGFRIIHYVCMHTNYKILKYTVEKGVDIEAPTDKEGKHRPIHFVCKNHNKKSIKYMLNKDVSLEKKESDHMVVQYMLLNRNILSTNTSIKKEFILDLVDALLEFKSEDEEDETD